MALPFFNWSRTASSNATADSTVNWAEGQLPSTVNDSARAMMASTAAFRDDIAGAITTGGTATAYTVTSYQVFDTLAHLSGQNIAFVPHATNTNAVGVDVTLNVDGLGAKSIRMAPSVALPNGTLILGTPYIVTYNNSDSVFYLQNMTNPYSIPLGAGMDYWGTTTPNSSFAFPTGQQLSQTTYATLYALFGANKYGTDSGGLFNLPDKTGRISAMKEASATRLTSTYFGGNSATLGAVGGAESHLLTTAEMPSHTHANSLTDPGHNHTIAIQATQTFTLGSAGPPFTVGGTSSTANSTTGISITNAAQGGGGSHAIVQPTIVCNYIIRVI